MYVLGLHLSEYDVTSCNRERWTAQRDGVSVVCNIQGWPADRKTRTERVRSRLIVNEGSHERRYETHWTFHTYDLPQLKRLTRRVRDVFNHVATYDFRYRIDKPMELDGEQLDNVLILRKRV